jgi:hypothetical protein
VLTKPDTARGESNHWSPFALPGGGAVLFTIVGTSSDPQVAVLDLKNGHQKTLIRGGAHPAYIDGGHLVYAALGSLRAVRFDPVNLEVLSDPVPVMDDVTMGRNAADFSVSRSGALLYVPGGEVAGIARTLAWLDRTGREEPIKTPPRGFLSVHLSPDDTRIAICDGLEQPRHLDCGHLARPDNPAHLRSVRIRIRSGRRMVAGCVSIHARQGPKPVPPRRGRNRR